MEVSEHWVFGRRAAQSFLAPESAAEVLEAVLSDRAPPELRRMAESRLGAQHLHHCKQRDMERRFPGQRHQGIALRLRRPLPAGQGADWRDLASAKQDLLIVLDRLQDVHNVGAIIRSAEALGVGGLILTGKGAAMTPAVHRVAAGATAHLPIFQESNLNSVQRSLGDCGRWICASASAADLEQSERELRQPFFWHDEFSALPPAGELALVIGSEGDGVKPLALERADYILSIRLSGATASLNASVAAAILIDRLIHRN
ncbi:MAG: RNA methyltransferase [Leptospirales bacterium]|nr:RNA methyltransferase [Leptospirales bacterium]